MNLGILSSDYINLIPDSPQAFESQQIVREAKKHFDEVYLIDPFKSYIQYKDKRLTVFAPDMRNEDQNIFDNIDCLYVKRTRSAIDQILDIITIVNSFYKHIVIQDCFESFDRPTSKVTSLINRFSIFKQPKTIVIFNKDFNPNNYPIEYPIVIKPSAGLQGIGVELCKNRQELEQYISRVRVIGGGNKDHGYGFLIQEEVKIKEEFRIVVIGGKSLGCVKKIQNDDKVARNYAQGAEFEKVKDPKAEEIAVKASLNAKHSFSGVDVAITEEDEYFVLECNRNPNYTAFRLATGINVSRLICLHLIDQIQKNKLLNNSKKKIFIGSSGQRGKVIAEAVHLNLSDTKIFETRIWNHSVFQLSGNNLDSLIKAAQNSDYAILILTPDDKVFKKNEEVFIPRDNVLFELGLFMGILGSRNVFMLVPEEEKVNLPSDLDGIVYATYQSLRSDGNIQAGVDIGCIKIKNEIISRRN